MNKKLTRSTTDSKIAGVCGGLGQFFGIDSTLVRILFLAALILAGTGLWLYFIIWIVAPKDSDIL